MAIKIISGVLGAGKTYYCVSELLKKYYIYDEVLDEWLPKNKNSLDVITNIDGLKLPCIPLDVVIDSAGGLPNYFCVESHLNTDDKQKIIIIDEAQKYFDRKFYDKSVFEFFQYSRHLGIDIYLITQDVTSLARELQNIAEYEVQTVRRSFQVGVEFRYHLIANGEKIKTKVLKKDPRVFAVYRSHNIKEAEKISSVPIRFLIFFIFSVFLVVGAYILFFKGGRIFGVKPSSVESSKRIQSLKSISPSFVPQPQSNFSGLDLNQKNNIKSEIQTVTQTLKLPECNMFGSSCIRHVGYIEYELVGSKGVKEKIHIYSPSVSVSEHSGERKDTSAGLPPSPLQEGKVAVLEPAPEPWHKTVAPMGADTNIQPLGGKTK